MEVQIFGTQKCNDTKKALRFFKERGIKTHFVDLNEKGFSEGELKNILSQISIEELFDKEGKEFKKQNLKYMTYDPEEKLFENPLLAKTPVARYNKMAVCGYQPDVWKNWVKNAQ